MASCYNSGCDREATHTLICGGEIVELCEGCDDLVELAAQRAVDLIRAAREAE